MNQPSETERKILVIEIDITDFDSTWTIEISKSELWLSQGVEKQTIAKRTSKDDLIYVPHLEENNFIKSITIETHES
jgi:hypothetical protein